MTRVVSTTFVVLALAVFKPFGLGAWHWHAYIHLLVIWVMGVGICMLTDIILKYLVKMPRSYSRGVGYIIRRNLWFQFINTPLVALGICLYRHFVLSNQVESNLLSWGNYLETLIIIAFCSFAIGLYWRFKFRSRYLAAELEETRLLNEQLQLLQANSTNIPQSNNVSTEVPVHNDVDSEQAETTERGLKSDSKENNRSVSTPLSPRRGAGGEAVMGEAVVSESPLTLKGTTSDSITLQVSDLLYVEAVGNYVKVFHLRDGRVRTDMLRATSKQIEEDLSAYPMIVRCHRAFLVNLGQVEQFVSKSGTMQLIIRHCHESLPVSRSNMSQIKKAILR